MLLSRRLVHRKQLLYTVCSRWCTQQSHVASQFQEKHNLELRLPQALEKEPQREPFAKNLFLGTFDNEFMYYPEPQTKERHTEFFEWLRPVKQYILDNLVDSQNIKEEDILDYLRKQGVFRAHVSEKYHGLGLSQTELAVLTEVLSYLPWLGSYFTRCHIAPINLFYALASEKQKAKYMPKIASGEIVPSVCFTECNNGLNTKNIRTNAVISEDGAHWILNGEKSFVINGRDSNLLLVFANCNSTALSMDPSITDVLTTDAYSYLSVFVIEQDANGITYKDTNNLVGHRNNSVCTVTFRNTKVPVENMLGDIGAGINVLIDSLAPGNRHIAPQAVGALKAFTKLLTNHVLQRKHLDQNLHDYHAVQEIIGKIATTLYGMESMLYMTTGIMDKFENQDCTLEKTMLETFCANECTTCIYEGLQLIGAHGYLKGNLYMQFLEDALSYILFDCYNIDSSTYIALVGLRHTGKNLHKQIYKLRNPLMFPQTLLKRIIGKEPKLNLKLANHMHQSMFSGSQILEECIYKLSTASVMLLQQYGTDVATQQMMLRRLSEIATKTFALVAVLSRASRSYCIGSRNANQERELAGGFAVLTLDRVRNITDEILAEEWNNGDRLFKNVAALMYEKKDYFAEHPLNRTY